MAWPEYDDSYDPPVFDIPETGPILTGESGGGFGWPDSSSVFDVLGKVGTAIGGVAKSVYEFQNARETTQFNRQVQQKNNELELVKAQGAIDVEKYRAQQQGLLQRMQLAANSGLDDLMRAFGGSGGSGSGMLYSTGGNNSAALLMLAAAGVGLYIAFKK